jgi:hypothetical protein
MWRKQVARRVVRWATAQAIGVVAGIAAATQSGVLHGGGTGPVAWYGLILPARPFWLGLLALAFGWALLGAYRLMRQELRYRTYPWAWTGFVLFCMALAGGLAYGPAGLTVGDWRWAYVMTGLVLTYAALFAEPKTVLRYRLLLGATEAGDMRRALASTPLWLPAYALTVLAAVLVMLGGGSNVWTPLLVARPACSSGGSRR